MKMWIVVEIDTHNEDGVYTRNFADLEPYYSKIEAQKAADKLKGNFTDAVIKEIAIPVDMLPHMRYT
jgi:hypothetical protein